MKDKMVRNEEDELCVCMPYLSLFNETYDPEGYGVFSDIEIVFKNTEGQEKPSIQQINAYEYFIQNSFELSEFVSEYIFNEREVLLERGFHIEHLREPKKNYRFKTIYIDDEFRDDFSFIGMTGICAWDEEHGLGAVLFKKEMVDFGDWNCGYTLYTTDLDEHFSLAEKYSLKPLSVLRKELSDLSQNIEIDNIENHLSLIKWLIELNVIYGYRDSNLDLNDREIVALVQSLEELDLSGKNLDSLHQNFNLLLNLKDLNLGNNNFREFPEIVCDLDLEILSFYNNQLVDLPESCFGIQNLKRLNLSHNQLLQAPELLGNLTSLTFLDLSDNQISSLPKSYEKLNRITYVSISNNQFESLPEVLRSWKELKLLYVFNNKIKILPKWIGELTELTNLGLTNNHIDEIPSEIGNLSKLIDLGLGGNNIVALPEKIENFNGFCSINIKNNQLTDLPKSAQNVRTLYVWNNKIPEEKLVEYQNWIRENPYFFNNDFSSELSRIREEKVKVTSNNVQTEIKKESKAVKNKKSGCLGFVSLFFLLFVVTTIIGFFLKNAL